MQELTVEKLAREYLEICEMECAGDYSVGIPPCEFYKGPDEDENGKPISSYCRLKKLLQDSEKE